MTSLIGKLFGRDSRLSALELLILNSVWDQLSSAGAGLWDKQVGEINKVQRLPDGVEVNFYRMKGGKPSFDDALAFANQEEELLAATVKVSVPTFQETLTANVWCVRGFVFSIEYKGSAKYFEEAAGMDPAPSFQIDCQLNADLSKPH